MPDFSISKPSPDDVNSRSYLAGIEIPKIEADCAQIIIGIDSPALYMFSEIQPNGNSKLWEGKSPLGWVLRSRDGTSSNDSRCSVNLLVDPVSISLCLCQFDYVDRVCDPSILLPSLDDKREEVCMGASCTYENERYQNGVFWRNGCLELPHNYSMVSSRLKCLGKRLLANPELLAKC